MSKLTLRQRHEMWAYTFLLVPLLFFLFIRIYPALFAMNVSLREWSILSPEKPWVGLANFEALFADGVFGRAMLNTLVYVAFGVPLQMGLSLVVALLIQRVNRFAGVYRMLYFIPYVTSSVAVAWTWKWMFQQHYGIINQLLLSLGLPQMGFLRDPSQAIFCIITVIVWQAMGFNMVIFLAGLEQVPTMYYEAAQIDGANRRQLFRYITLPLLNPTIVFSAVIGSIRFLQIFTEVQNMSYEGTGGPLNSTISIVLYIYQKAFRDFTMGYASATTVVLFIIIMAVTLFQMKVLTRRFEY